MIIFDYSQEYLIKPLKEYQDTLVVKDIIANLSRFERVQNDAKRILLTANSEELLIHYPSGMEDDLLDEVEKQFRSFHDKIGMFVADTVVTVDIFAQRIQGATSKGFYKFLIIDLLNFNGIDYRTTELGMRRKLMGTFFKSFIVGSNIDILQPVSIVEADNSGGGGIAQITKKDMITGQYNYDAELWQQILLRDEKSTYNQDFNDEWILIDPKSLPAEIFNAL